MKTAMQIAVESLISEGLSFTDWFAFNYERLLEKEKEQIIEAIDYYKKQPYNAFDDEYVHTGEDYYNQTYKLNK